jgi:hypothetical protein
VGVEIVKKLWRNLAWLWLGSLMFAALAVFGFFIIKFWFAFVVLVGCLLVVATTGVAVDIVSDEL